jgi:hypothetical protein
VRVSGFAGRGARVAIWEKHGASGTAPAPRYLGPGVKSTLYSKDGRGKENVSSSGASPDADAVVSLFEMRRVHPRSPSAIAATLSLVTTLASAQSPDLASRPAPRPTVAAELPPLERAEYLDKLGALDAGTGEMEVVGHETVDAHDTYHIVLHIEGGLGPLRIDDRFESWVDAASWNDRPRLFSRRFVQDQRELGNRRQRRYEFSPERKQSRRLDTDETSPLATDRPLDDVSMVYLARGLPLKTGDVYTIDRYFKPEANPIVLRVVRRETVTVPAGTFQTVVVRPTIKTSGLFGEGGEAELFFSDDAQHTLVQMRSKVPLIGTLSLLLSKQTPPAAAGTTTAPQ